MQKPPTEKSPEWKYFYDERIGMMCGDAKPTAEQVKIAEQLADEYVKGLAS